MTPVPGDPRAAAVSVNSTNDESGEDLYSRMLREYGSPREALSALHDELLGEQFESECVYCRNTLLISGRRCGMCLASVESVRWSRPATPPATEVTDA